MTPTQPPQGVMAELRELLARAIPGPWRLKYGVNVEAGDGYSATSLTSNIIDAEARNAANAALIVAAVNALPGLLDEVDRLQAEAEKWRAKEAFAVSDLQRQLRAENERASALLARCEGLEALLVRIRDDRSWRTNDNTLWRDICAATRTTGDG